LRNQNLKYKTFEGEEADGPVLVKKPQQQMVSLLQRDFEQEEFWFRWRMDFYFTNCLNLLEILNRLTRILF
jgi:hypothetical protein